VTQDYRGTAAPSSAPPERGPVDLVAGSGPCMTSELTCLLRRRLRIAALILTGGFAAFLVRNLWGTAAYGPSSFDLSLHAAVTVVIAVLVGLLWTRLPMCL